MPRRAPRFPIPLPRGAVKLLVVLNVAVAGLLGGWFVLQPETRQREVRRLVENAFEHHKRVSALDVAWDLWQLYYADSATGRIATGDNAIVYGGAPRPDSVANAPSFRVLINRGYAVGYSDALGNPVWVAYRVRDLARLPTPAARPDKFETDRRTAARVAPADYANSGYDRGHMAPNYAIATRYGEVTVKRGRLDGEVVQVAPEHESCRRLAEQAKVPLKKIYEAAHRATVRASRILLGDQELPGPRSPADRAFEVAITPEEAQKAVSGFIRK